MCKCLVAPDVGLGNKLVANVVVGHCRGILAFGMGKIGGSLQAVVHKTVIDSV